MIDFISALAGAGKTYAIIRKAHRLALRGEKVLIVQPSRELISRTVAGELLQLSLISYRVITTDSHPQAVSATIIDHLAHPSQGGEILFVTHAAFLALPYFASRQNWIVFIDEIPSVDFYQEHTIPESHQTLTENIETTEYDLRYCSVRASDTGEAALRKIAENKRRDDVWALFSPLAKRILDPDWRVYALDYQLQSLIKNEKDEECKFLTYSLLQPSKFEGFKKLVIAGACFEDSLLYKLWKADGVQFRPYPIKLRYNEHRNGDLISIRYAVEGRWSKVLRDRVDDLGESSLEKFILASMMAVNDEPCAFMANKDQPEELMGPHGVRLPNSPHGLNDYQHLHNVVVFSALNNAPPHFAFLNSRGVSSEEVKDAGFRQSAYQAVNRISIRNPDDQTPKMVIVPDRATAEWLSGLFPGARISKLDDCAIDYAPRKTGRPILHKTDNDRKLAHKKSERLRHLKELTKLNRQDCQQMSYAAIDRLGDESTINRGIPSLGLEAHPLTYGGSIYEHKRSSQLLAYVDYSDDESFISGLRDMWTRVVRDKESAGLISPAVFDAELSDETNRGLANISFMRGLWLDNDGGDLTPEMFARLFPRLRMVIMNTYRSTPENKRWRVFIPTTLAMAPELHRAILDAILEVLKVQGYSDPDWLRRYPRTRSKLLHGFDLSKLTSSSLFFLPSQAEHSDGSVWLDFNDDARHALEPDHFAERVIHLGEPAPEPVPSIFRLPRKEPQKASEAMLALRAALVAQAAEKAPESRQNAVERAIEAWQSEGCRKGHGHHGFFILASSLRRAGMEVAEIEAELQAQARWSSSPAERRGEIGALIRKVTKFG